MMKRVIDRLAWLPAWVGLLWIVSGPANLIVADESMGEGAGGSLIKVPFPLSAEAESRVLTALESIASKGVNAERPLVVLEFVPVDSANRNPENDRIGRGTSFERSLSLARWLSGTRGSRLRSIAYLPESICGHAVLVALGCEEIAMNPAAEIGLAGIDEPNLEPTVRQAYLDIAARRSLFPIAAVRSMIDPSESLTRLDLEGGATEYVSATDLEARPRPANVWKETPLVANNQMATFTGQEIRTWRWFVHLVPDRELLARSLKLDGEIKEKSAFDGPRVAMRSHLKGIVNPRQVNRIIRAIDESLSEGANLILLELDSPGGNIEESMLLAQHLANIPSKQAEVVVLVTGHARGDAALVALAADNLYMTRDAMLGGVGEASINPAECEKRKGAILGLAKSAALSPGDLVGCMCPDATVFEYTAADGRKQRNVAGWIDDDPKLPLWTQGGEISYRGGLSFERAQLLGLAVDSEPSLEAVGIVYGIDQLPAEKQTNTTEQIVEWIASHRWLSMLLFIIGIVCLSAELNTPGVGVPGAIAAVCFLLFFWINMFQGTVEWLEILLIAGGVVCLGIELFLLPGFGVFGVCGIGMLAVGLILAGQTFVLPTNEYQWEQVISGSGQLGFGVFVLLGLAIAFRKQLANLPMVRWFALQPSQDTGLEEIAQTNQELRGLIGRYGTTLTRCNPYGKASIGDESIDVASRDEWIDEDTDIEVIDVEGTSLIVRRRVS